MKDSQSRTLYSIPEPGKCPFPIRQYSWALLSPAIPYTYAYLAGNTLEDTQNARRFEHKTRLTFAEHGLGLKQRGNLSVMSSHTHIQWSRGSKRPSLQTLNLFAPGLMSLWQMAGAFDIGDLFTSLAENRGAGGVVSVFSDLTSCYQDYLLQSPVTPQSGTKP